MKRERQNESSRRKGREEREIRTNACIKSESCVRDKVSACSARRGSDKIARFSFSLSIKSLIY